MNNDDTIIAQATPPGRGGIGILRISGKRAVEIAQRVLGKLPKARYANYLSFKMDNNVLDKGIALWFPAPNSFTGEDVLELQGHGGPVVLDLLLKHILTMPGVRLAKPGEFSERAFLNEKIDLTQAEAISDLINASSEQSVRAAMNSLQGALSTSINCIVEQLTHLRIHIEASINFPDDEESNFLSDEKIETKLNDIIQDLNNIQSRAQQGILLREGMKVVIAGYPNSGKSSLLNALTGREAAIVTNIAGTTRDVLHEYIHVDGIPFHIVDTAGLRESINEIEQIGIERAWREIKFADFLLLVVDGTTTSETDPAIILPDIIAKLPTFLPITVIRNKSDITGESVQLSEKHGYSFISLSAHTREGIDLLRTHLKNKIGFNNIEGNFLARRRHLQALKLVHIHLQQGKIQLASNFAKELVAEELCLAQKALSEITGGFTSDDLLNQIFSNFCIGK